MRSVWGTGYGFASPAISQRREEFRRQRHRYRGLRWLSVGEERPTSGIEGDMSKVSVTVGRPPLSWNREAETHYATRTKFGKRRATNPDNAPNVPSAGQTSYRRRLRRERARSKLSANPEEPDHRDGVLLSDDTTRGWARSEEAASVIRIHMPFIRSRRKSHR